MKRLLLAVMLFACLTPAYASDAKETDPVQLFYSADRYYQSRDYAKAIEEYNKILDTGIESGNLYYNLGNSYFKMGELGHAILCYERARRLIPQDGDLKSNLEYAQSLVGTSTSQADTGNPLLRAVKRPFQDFNLNAIAISAVILYLVMVLFLTIGMLNPFYGRKLGAGAFVFVLLFLLNLGAFAIRFYDEDMLRRGVVVAKETDVKYEPIDTSTTYYKLQEGNGCIVLETNGAWQRIRRSDGKVGWLKKDAVEEI